MEWLRYYTDTLESRKIQSLPAPLFKAWVNLLCVARIFDGVIPADEASFRLRVTEKQITDWLAELQSRKLVDVTEDGTFYPHDWDEHQKVSDDAAGRKRIQRERQRRDKSRDMSRDSNGTCPALDQIRADTEQSRADAAHGTEPRFGTWQADETYTPFVEMYRKSGKSVIDEDFIDAWWAWKVLDFEQKAERIAKLKSNLKLGCYDKPQFIPGPRKFIDTEWKRDLSPDPDKKPWSGPSIPLKW